MGPSVFSSFKFSLGSTNEKKNGWPPPSLLLLRVAHYWMDASTGKQSDDALTKQPWIAVEKNGKEKKKEKSEKQKLTATPSLREPNNQFRSNDGRRLYQEENVEIRRCAGAFF